MKPNVMRFQVLLGLTMCLTAPVIAADLKIGAVDVAKVLSEYHKAKDANSKLKDNAETAKKELTERLDAFKKLNDEAKALSKDAADAGLPASVRAQARTDVQTKVVELRALEQDIQDFRQRRSSQLESENTQQRKNLHDEILKVILEKTKAGGYDLVFDRSGVSAALMPFPLHAREGLAVTDLTSEVIAQLNKNAPSGESGQERKGA